ncbi:peptide/nickel transport system ATP-binding protein [Bradyrhizobium sp. LM3.2]
METQKPAADEVLLDVRNLETHFYGEEGIARVLGGISFQVKSGEILGIVGESGCGKSVTALSILRLLPKLTGKTIGGEIHFHGRDLLKLSAREMRKIRGGQIAMIFQEPMTSLSPVHTVGRQIAEAVQIHTNASRSEAMARSREMLHLVRIADPHRRVNNYPHEMSGGMRQRAMIAMSLACSPKLLIADEPTTALDVTIQAQILRLIVDLKERMGTAVMLITHDLGVVAETCERVIVMYGRPNRRAGNRKRSVRASHASLHSRTYAFGARSAKGPATAASRNSRHCTKPTRAHHRMQLCPSLRVCPRHLPSTNAYLG